MANGDGYGLETWNLKLGTQSLTPLSKTMLYNMFLAWLWILHYLCTVFSRGIIRVD